MLNINDLNQLLEHRHAAKLCYEQTWPGMSKDRSVVDAHITICATVHDCINRHRHTVFCSRGSQTALSATDRELLRDFITVNHAYLADM
jgi:hypothetical protein